MLLRLRQQHSTSDQRIVPLTGECHEILGFSFFCEMTQWALLHGPWINKLNHFFGFWFSIRRYVKILNNLVSDCGVCTTQVTTDFSVGRTSWIWMPGEQYLQRPAPQWADTALQWADAKHRSAVWKHRSTHWVDTAKLWADTAQHIGRTLQSCGQTPLNKLGGHR